ncbi:MAG TPA: hypothetical protein VKL21_03635, partial [Candidatus Methanoperedens sp.]|nr:hypothetical protein [Candidatus Methanoperedens sp.]
MWANIIFMGNVARGIVRSKNRFIKSLMLTAAIVVILISIPPVFAYTNNTTKCISCHNDTTYPFDTDGDGVAAPYKRPHNNLIMCESCHLPDPHIVKFIQPDGGYGGKSTAASCPECHQNGIPSQNNSNFTSAPLITPVLRHSQNILNGSIWGNYWTNTSLNTACKYCHDNTLHNITAFGRILLLFPGYQRYGELANNYTCAGCHYKNDPKWNQMNLTFTSKGLPIPPEITNGTNWNGKSFKYYNHSLQIYDDKICRTCHGSFLSANANMTEFVHNVAEGAGGEECLACHVNDLGKFPGINVTLFGRHKNVNTTDGDLGTLKNSDCRTCHYDFSNMSDVQTYTCNYCHDQGNFSAPMIKNHQPNGVNITTAAYCSTCHKNSINRYAFSENASVAHYGTNTTLIKPTVNQSAVPRFGFATGSEASAYNRDCNNC